MYKLNLALGGGGTKGFTHIGVIRQLEKEGYEVKGIAGTSAGGIVGALYCFGYSSHDIENFSKELSYSELFNRSKNDAPSLLGLGGLYKLLEKKIGLATFEDLKIPFAATAVDVHSGQEIILNTGKVIDAVKATTAIPGIFPSLNINQLCLVDGGILDPVPTSVARWLNPNFPILAVSLTPPMEKRLNTPRLDIPPYVPIPQFIVEQISQLRLGKAMRVFIDSMEITTNAIAELRLKLDKPDAAIFPDIYHYTMFDKVDINELIQIGERSVVEAIDKIRTVYSISNRTARWFRVAKPPGYLLSDVLNKSALSEK